MISVKYKADTMLEKEFDSMEDASKFISENEIIKFEYLDEDKASTNLMTSDAIHALLDESILDVYAEESINEVKRIDHPHGDKIPHARLQSFFKDEAPKYNSLQAVEQALGKLYKQNGIEFEPNGLKQVISQYKKRMKVVSESETNDFKMTTSEMNKREEIVKSMKKKIGEFRAKYGSKAKLVLYAPSTKLAQKD